MLNREQRHLGCFAVTKRPTTRAQRWHPPRQPFAPLPRSATLSTLALALLCHCTPTDPTPPPSTPPAPTLHIRLLDGTEHTWTHATLAAALPDHLTTVEVHSPVYHRPMRYRGYPLAAVLRATGAAELTRGELEFHCADGFVPTIATARIDPLGLFLAIDEPTAPAGHRWTPLPNNPTATPGPYYVIGTAPDAYTHLPWPYQLTAIRAVDFAATYPDVYPRGASPDAPAHRGFLTFRSACLGCHSINLQGGDIGPELNIPQSITEYRRRDTLRAFIRDPRAFRARTKMPAFPLDDRQLDELLSYLDHMATLKKPLPP